LILSSGTTWHQPSTAMTSAVFFIRVLFVECFSCNRGAILPREGLPAIRPAEARPRRLRLEFLPLRFIRFLKREKRLNTSKTSRRV
jgi:hypothetical protein